MPRLSIRIDFDQEGRLGPGKVPLLERIEREGSISAAGRAMNMSYKRAWELVSEINHTFEEPLVAAQTGGRAGGGAALTPRGHELIRHYRAIERKAFVGDRGASQGPAGDFPQPAPGVGTILPELEHGGMIGHLCAGIWRCAEVPPPDAQTDVRKKGRADVETVPDFELRLLPFIMAITLTRGVRPPGSGSIRRRSGSGSASPSPASSCGSGCTTSRRRSVGAAQLSDRRAIPLHPRGDPAGDPPVLLRGRQRRHAVQPRQRAVVYQRAKTALDKRPFGTQHDVYERRLRVDATIRSRRGRSSRSRSASRSADRNAPSPIRPRCSTSRR